MTRSWAFFCLAAGAGGCAYSLPAKAPALVGAASPEIRSDPSEHATVGRTEISGEAGRDEPAADPSTDTASPTATAASADTSPAAAPQESPPLFFEGRTEVTYREFIDELRKIADALQVDPDVVAAHGILLEEKSLSEDELPLQSFSRARLAFESARDSGLWGIRGTVTDQMPWSDRIWQQWSTRTFTPDTPVALEGGHEFPTAVAECDELGALFSILARDLGIIGFVGLHWPYWNHVVPVWQIDRKDGSFVRLIVPATQTFLGQEDTIGTTGLPLNRIVFPYVRRDRKPEATLSVDLARYLLTQSQTHGGLSTRELTNRRLWHRWNNR